MEFIARQVQVPASEPGFYAWTSRRRRVPPGADRAHLGFRECGFADAEKLTAYLVEHVAHEERRPERVRVQLPALTALVSSQLPVESRYSTSIGPRQ
ncbi:hypothetical protein ACWGNE_23515 [Streptomyces xiamenensis]